MNSTANIIEHPGEKLYAIGTMSKLTGVDAITLRAWELGNRPGPRSANRRD